MGLARPILYLLIVGIPNSRMNCLYHSFMVILLLTGLCSCNSPNPLPTSTFSATPSARTAIEYSTPTILTRSPPPTTRMEVAASLTSSPTPSVTPTEAVWSVQKMPTAHPPPTCCPPTNTPEPFIPGITEMSYVPYVSPRSVVISAQWRELVNNQQTYVYSGALRNDESVGTPWTRQGLVIVETYSADRSNLDVTLYKAPGETGLLKITRAVGNRIILITDTNAILYFDVLTRQFVDGLAVTLTAPTITPLPSQTPTATARPGYPPPETPTPYPGL